MFWDSVAAALQIPVSTIFTVFIIFFIIIVLIAMAIRIVPEYERVVIFRLGRAIGPKGPGLIIIIPFVDRVVRMDLRERFIQIPHQTNITKDNAPVAIDFLIYFRIIDPGLSVLQVQNFEGAAIGIATTTLRAVVGDIMLDEVLARREQINAVLRTKLDEVTERWGVKVTTVEIREIMPPKDVQDAMIKQMSAERSRRAVVTEADGKREATIKVAEGDKQSAILKAEGDRQAAILRAEGFAQALETVFGAAKVIDHKTMIIQYLEALKQLGASPATKFVFPMEFTSLLQPIQSFVTKMRESSSEAEERKGSSQRG